MNLTVHRLCSFLKDTKLCSCVICAVLYGPFLSLNDVIMCRRVMDGSVRDHGQCVKVCLEESEINHSGAT